MADVSRLENQLSQLTEQLTKLNITTKEQFKQSKLGANYNPFSSAFAAPSYIPSMYLDGSPGNPVRLSRVKGKFSPFSHNRLDAVSETSNLSYLGPQDRIRSDTNEVSALGRKVEGVSGAGAGILGASLGSKAGQVVGASVASKLIGGKLGLALGTLLPGVGGLAAGALGAAVGASAFKAVSGSNQRVSANAIHEYMMENSFKFMNPNQSDGTTNPLGSGFGYEDSRKLSREIPLMTDDLNLNVKTLMDLSKSFTEGDMMKGVNTTKEFSDRFKELTETAKTMAYLLNDSIEDAGQFMSDLQLRGFDTSKLANQSAKMKNLSQFLGKDVSEVAQTAVGHASNNVAGTNMSFTTALENQTYTTRIMSEISDSYLKRGDESYKSAYDLIKNMNGPEEAANMYAKVMQSTFLGDSHMQDQSLMAGLTYDLESDSFSFDKNKFDEFKKKDFTFGEGHEYAQRELVREYTKKKRVQDPDFQATPDLIYQEFFANRQRIVGSMDAQDQASVLQDSLAKMRKEAPDNLKNVSDRALLTSTFGFDETTAEMAVAVMRKSSENFSDEYENSGRLAEYVAKQKANNTGLVGDIKRFGANVSNTVAGFGMELTSPIQNLADRMTKAGSDYLFGNKDFDYTKEFGIKDEVLKEYFADDEGRVDPAKIGKNFYEAFEKGLKDAQKKGMVVSELLLGEVSAMAKSVVKRTSAEDVLSGEDYNVQRWKSDSGLSEYAKQNYAVIQEAAVKNKISDQALAYVGITQNMTPDLLEKAAPELQRLMKAYGGNETLAIAAFEKGEGVVDQALKAIDVDIEGARERGDFTEFNRDENVSELSKNYAKEMETASGVKATEWQGTDRTIQSKSQAATTSKDSKDEQGKTRALLMGAIELNKGGLPRATGESTLDARLDALGVEFTSEMSRSEKEALLYVSENSYNENIRGLESYTRWGTDKGFLELSEEERGKTVNAYLSQLAGQENLTWRQSRAYEVIRQNEDDIIKGKFSVGSSALKSSNTGTVNPLITSSSYDEINSTTIEELKSEAKKADTKIVSEAIKAQELAKVLVDNVDFGDISASDKAKGKQKIMSALYSGDQAQIDLVKKEFDFTDFEKQELTRLGSLKVGDTGLSLLGIDPEAYETKTQDQTQAAIAKTTAGHESAKLLLKDLNFSDDYINSVSLSSEEIEASSLAAVEAKKQDMLDRAADTIALLSDSDLTELLNNGSFSESELEALTSGASENRNSLIQNEDGLFSFNKDIDEKASAKLIAEYGLEEFKPGLSKEGTEEDKREEAKKELNDATAGLLESMESTTDVLIQGTDKLIKRQDELAQKLDIYIPSINNSGAPKSGNR